MSLLCEDMRVSNNGYLIRNKEEVDSIMKLAKKHKLAVIEDAACALGSKHKEKWIKTC